MDEICILVVRLVNYFCELMLLFDGTHGTAIRCDCAIDMHSNGDGFVELSTFDG